MQPLDIVSFFEDNEIVQWAVWGILALLGLYFVRFLLRRLVPVLNKLFYIFIKVLCFPFGILNWFQRFLAKPWYGLCKNHHGGDGFNKFMRGFCFLLKIPLYFALTPLRLVNAVCYNIILHTGFELFNYIVEICDPTSSKEGGANFFTWLLLLPLRVVKYVWHFLLVVIESGIWTVIDTIVPTLTLYHGTTKEACENITQSPGRICGGGDMMGKWWVGGGNFAGDGIYFAPARSTAEHYAYGYMIVCRVSLGRVLDLGMAPTWIFNACGHSNAHEVTKWGLDHNYTTGEWWRGKGADWWEYCMYDWNNRYNYSWRIRPLYVEDLLNKRILRIRGGMVHWLFRKMVVQDMLKSLSRR